jgi:predicted nucleic acid-binding protein
MIHGLDTSCLVAAEVIGHPNHVATTIQMQQLAQQGDLFAIPPQVLAEFVHIVTDSRRFPSPLDITAAIQRAEVIWNSQEIHQIYPTSATVPVFLNWLKQYQLGRKRLLDTLLAATCFTNGIQSMITLNRGDFELFGIFQIIEP